MSLTCVMLAAILCGPPEYKEAIWVFSRENPQRPISGLADVAPLGVQINVYWPGRPGFAPRRILDRACDGETCIYYRKGCNAEQRVCNYVVGIDFRSPRSLYIDIQYHSLKELREAERQIFLVPAPGSPARIALSKLDHTSDSWTFESCIQNSAPKPIHIEGCD